MTYRPGISNALVTASVNATDIIIALCRATDENHDPTRLEYLNDARKDAAEILQAIDAALATPNARAS